MKIGPVTDSLGHLPFEDMLDTAQRMGITEVELCCGNWSSAPHIELDIMLESRIGRQALLQMLAGYGMTISALNCSGNPLHPGPPGAAHHLVTRPTIVLAELPGVNRVGAMSGWPGGPGAANPNRITTPGPGPPLGAPPDPLPRRTARGEPGGGDVGLPRRTW